MEPSLRRAQTGQAPRAIVPELVRSRSAPKRRTWETGNSSPLPLCAEVAWDIHPPESLPCPYHRRGEVESICISWILPQGLQSLDESTVLRAQFLCHRSKFAAELLGFSRPATGQVVAEDQVTMARFFYAKPFRRLTPQALAELSFQERLTVAHGTATALWNLHSLGASFGRWHEAIGLNEEGKVQLVGVGLPRSQASVVEDLQGLASLLLTLSHCEETVGVPLSQEKEGNERLRDLAKELIEVGNHESLQATVTTLAMLMRIHEEGPSTAGRNLPIRPLPRGRSWTLLRHVWRACCAFQQGLEAFCCVCLEAAPKSLGLLCARHDRHPLLCGDCLEPYVCSLIGTAELRRYEGGVQCPACACSDGESTIFTRVEVQAKLVGPVLRRFVEATEPQEIPEEEDTEDTEWAVLLEDLVSRSVRLVTKMRVSEKDDAQEVRKSKDVLPHTWLLCEGEETFIEYDPQQFRLRQHLSARVFQLQVAECLTMHCPKCYCPLDPDPDGCVAMSCLACNEGFCWVCFTPCGDDAHEHAMTVHGSYFPGHEFVQAWHRKLRWERVQRILRQLLEASQTDALEESKGLLQDMNLWPFPVESPDAPLWAEQQLNVDGDMWGPIHLHLAARLGRLEELQQALEVEDVNLQDERGMTALCYACHEGRMEAIRLLMARGANPNLADQHGVTPLHYACREPPFAIEDDVVGLLLDYPEVEGNQRDDTGASAILVAAEVGRHQVIPSLLRCHRVDPNLTNHAGRTALLVASYFDHKEVVMELLRSPRVAVQLRSPEGETPLHLAARRGVEVLQLLLAHPDTELNAVTSAGRTALHEASSLGAAEVVQCLLSADGIMVDRPDMTGSTPLILAAKNGSLETFQQLLPLSHAVVNDKDQHGCTVLMHLAERGSRRGSDAHACLQLLLQLPLVNVDEQSADGSTALMMAVKHSSVPSVEDLLAFGANATEKFYDHRGETAWSLASLTRSAGVFRHLRSLLPRDTSAAPAAMLLFDGLLLHPIERANRTLLADGDMELFNSTRLTVEFESRTLWKWREAGYTPFKRQDFYEHHEDCIHELEIQRVNGQSFVNQELMDDDQIKLRSCRYVRRLQDWYKEGWTLHDDGRRLCHVGARKKAAPVIMEEVTLESCEVLEEFLDVFF